MKITLSSMLLLFISFLVPATAQVHRYQDSAGNWHFTDSKQGSQHSFSASLSQASQQVSNTNGNTNISVPDDLCPSDQKRRSNYFKRRKGVLGTKASVDIEHIKGDGEHSLVATNKYFAPVSVKVWLESNNGTRTEPDLPGVIEVPPHSTKQIVKFAPEQKGKAWRYRYRYSHRVGQLNTSHDRDCHYLFPVPSGKPYKITQSFNGDFSHKRGASQYAVDIGMKIGTPVLAARDGIVIAREEGFVLSGLTEKFKNQGNVVQILHGDGTIGIYVHLRFATIKVYEGEQVRAGQVIGQSGNTGYSTGPHLHFAVVGNQDMKWQSIPFKFHIDGKPHTPRNGNWLENAPAI